MRLLDLVLVAELVCPRTQIVDPVDAPWEPQDHLALVTAKQNCRVHFPQSPCLVRFERRAVGTYRATCGRPR